MCCNLAGHGAAMAVCVGGMYISDVFCLLIAAVYSERWEQTCQESV